MKPLVIYHDHCADGFGAAFAAWLKLGDEAEYLPLNYQNPSWQEDVTSDIYEVVKDRDVYILDFSFSKVVMETIFDAANRVVWLDHHKTAFEMYEFSNEKPIYEYHIDQVPHKVILDNSRSGALIAWNYFHPDEEPPALFQYIDNYDRGGTFQGWAIKGTEEFVKALWSYTPWSFEQWNVWNLHHPGKSTFYWEMLNSGAAVLRAHKQNVASVVRDAARKCKIEFNDRLVSSNDQPEPIRFYEFRRGLAANCPPHLSSDVGHELANQSGTFGLLWYIDKDNRCKCSLRSNGDYDVSTIAKAFGGGGHRNAAGFEVPIETLLEWLK